jgi:uncharacterized protein
VNARDATGATALLGATQWRDLKTVDLLLRARADANIANNYGIRPLGLACLSGSVELVERLLAGGADPNEPDGTGATPLMACARAGSAPSVKALLAYGADPLAIETSRGQNALMWAAAEGHTAVVKTLLEVGTDVHIRSSAGYTALLLAARDAHLETVRVLIAAGADVNEAAKDGMTALIVAMVRGHVDFAEYLLDQGANPNLGPGYTALHWAAGIFDTQLTDNSNGITSDNTEWSSFGGLREPEKLAFVKVLLAHGADPNAKLRRSPNLGMSIKGGGGGGIGGTPFFFAARANDVAIMRELVAHGADPLIAAAGNVTPLMAAAGVGHDPGVTRSYESQAFEAVKLCVELGADVNAVTSSGDTALHGAAWRERADSIVKYLVEHGANMNAKNRRDWTPLVIAEGIHTGGNFIRSDTTAALLRKLGAAPSPPNISREPDDSERPERER